MKRLFVFLGFCCVGLGAAGAALPVLPTTPFLLLALYCFGRGSERWKRWLEGTKLYKRHLASFVESRTMTWKAKLVILLPVSALLVLAALWVPVMAMRLFLGVLLLLKWYYFAFHIKTPARAKARVEVEKA